jgi:hypothetical protein
MSKFKISFLNNYITHHIFKTNDTNVAFINQFFISDIKQFLDHLELGVHYVIYLEYIPNFSCYDSEEPRIKLSEPIIVEKISNPQLIYDYIRHRIHLAFDT